MGFGGRAAGHLLPRLVTAILSLEGDSKSSWFVEDSLFPSIANRVGRRPDLLLLCVFLRFLGGLFLIRSAIAGWFCSMAMDDIERRLNT